MTPLMKAGANNRAAIVRLLLDKGADLHASARGPRLRRPPASLAGDLLTSTPPPPARPSSQMEDGTTALMKSVSVGAKDSSLVLLLETQKRVAADDKALLEWLKGKGLEGQYEAALPKVAAAAAGRVAAQERLDKAVEEHRKQHEARMAALRAEQEAAAKAEEARAAEEVGAGSEAAGEL